MRRFIFALSLMGMFLRPAHAEEAPLAIRIAEHAARRYEMDLLKVQLDSLQAGRDDAGDELPPEDLRWFEREIFRRQARLSELVAAESRATSVIISCGIGLDQSDKPLPALSPMLSGKIRRAKGNFIEVSLGSDDGLQVGHVLDVHRDGNRGRIIIRRTDPDVSVGEIMPEFQKLPIRRGDQVTPHWDSQRYEE